MLCFPRSRVGLVNRQPARPGRSDNWMATESSSMTRSGTNFVGENPCQPQFFNSPGQSRRKSFNLDLTVRALPLSDTESRLRRREQKTGEIKKLKSNAFEQSSPILRSKNASQRCPLGLGGLLSRSPGRSTQLQNSLSLVNRTTLESGARSKTATRPKRTGPAKRPRVVTCCNGAVRSTCHTECNRRRASPSHR